MTASKNVETARVFNRLVQTFRKVLIFPSWQDAGLAALSAILLILAFPDFELWFLAWFALVPLFVAVERNKNSVAKNFWLGLLNGFVFFTGTCWWLTYAPIVYGHIPAPLTYLMLIPATAGAGFFVGIFTAILSRLLSKFGHLAILLAPIVWAGSEFLRLQLTGNSWNALGYSQAFDVSVIQSAQFGGVFLIGFFIVAFNAGFAYLIMLIKGWTRNQKYLFLACNAAFLLFFAVCNYQNFETLDSHNSATPSAVVIALQPNVPMSGLTLDEYDKLLQRHFEMTEAALREVDGKPKLRDLPKIVVFPESPMSFQYAYDRETREIFREFNTRHKVSLIFNGWEPVAASKNLTNSAVMLNERGEKIAQYDKMRLVPFGEYIPEWIPLNQIMPTVAGRSVPGNKISLMPFGAGIEAGVMICYESAFGEISGQFVRNGADVLVEITNDGYSGDTPIIRQHLAHAVFRAVETNRPLLRVTNVGTTAYINERGEISEASNNYETATRIWTAAKSDGIQTFYVRYGDLFAWICVGLTFILLAATLWRKQ